MTNLKLSWSRRSPFYCVDRGRDGKPTVHPHRRRMSTYCATIEPNRRLLARGFQRIRNLPGLSCLFRQFRLNKVWQAWRQRVAS
jgi:hypothetical protein